MAPSGGLAVVDVLTSGEGVTWNGDVIEGTADLFTVAGAVSGKFVLGLGIPSESTARVPVRFRVQEGLVLGWEVDLIDIVESTLDARYRPELALDDDPSQRAAAFGGAMLRVTLDQDAEVSRVKAPEPHEVVEMTPVDTFQKRLASCA